MPFLPLSFQLHMFVRSNKYVVACIWCWMFVCMYVLACMLCLIWGCDALVLRRQEALVAPSWALSSLTTKECCRGHSAFLWDAPHATHTWRVYSTVKKTQTKHRCRSFVCMRCTESLHVWRECKHRGSISVDCIYYCDMLAYWMPRTSLRVLGSSGWVLLRSHGAHDGDD